MTFDMESDADQACIAQLLQERQQIAVEALRRLASGLGGEEDIRALAAEIGVTELVYGDRK